MQTLDVSMVAVKRDQLNFSLPEPMVLAFRGLLTQPFTKRQLSLVGGAAIVMFLEATEAERREMIRRVQDAKTFGSLEQLLANAKTKSDGPHKRGKAITNPPTTAATGKSGGRDR